MPKAKARRKNVTRKSTASEPTSARPAVEQATIRAAGQPLARSVRKSPARVEGLQGLWMSAMVALGCWGLAFTFLVFSNDANRAIFGGMAIIMALMWSVQFGMRVRKWRAVSTSK